MRGPENAKRTVFAVTIGFYEEEQVQMGMGLCYRVARGVKIPLKCIHSCTLPASVTSSTHLCATEEVQILNACFSVAWDYLSAWS